MTTTQKGPMAGGSTGIATQPETPSVAVTPTSPPATETPPLQTMDPRTQLEELEARAGRMGMSARTFRRMQNVGDCDVQIGKRVTNMKRWIRRQS